MSTLFYSRPYDANTFDHPVEPYSYGASGYQYFDAYMGYPDPSQQQTTDHWNANLQSPALQCCGLFWPTMPELNAHYEEVHRMTVAADGSVQPLNGNTMLNDAQLTPNVPSTPASSADQSQDALVDSYSDVNMFPDIPGQPPSYASEMPPSYNGLYPDTDLSWYPSPPEYCVPSQFFSTAPSTLENAVPMSDIMGQSARSRELNRTMNAASRACQDRPAAIVVPVANRVHNRISSPTAGSTEVVLNTASAVFTESTPPLSALPSFISHPTPLEVSEAEHSPCASPSSEKTFPQLTTASLAKEAHSAPVSPTDVKRKPIIASSKGSKKDKKSRGVTSGKRRKPNAGKHMDPADKPYKCPKTGCIKTYLNSNGLAYHLKKGTCEFSKIVKDLEKTLDLQNLANANQ